MFTTILLIEDDRQVRELLPLYFEREGMQVVTAPDGTTGLYIAGEQHPALVLLDVNLPDLDGWSILRRLRGDQTYQPAVIMLTGRSDVPDRLLGLDLGADDYIVKPFEPLEVVARVKAVLRRVHPAAASTDVLQFPGLTIDLAGRIVSRQGGPISLAPKEYDLLVALARQPGHVLTRQMLCRTVWEDGQGDDHTLDVHMNRLRQKLTTDDGMSYIATLRGVGYRFEVSHGTA
ncbi:MAG: response regulator transcription factor [Armatimonadota bacterium]